MIYDDYNSERRTDTQDTGYANVGSSGTNSANEYDKEYRTGNTAGNSGYGGSYGNRSSSYGSGQSRPHYTSFQDASYREPVGNDRVGTGRKPAKENGSKKVTSLVFKFWVE